MFRTISSSMLVVLSGAILASCSQSEQAASTTAAAGKSSGSVAHPVPQRLGGARADSINGIPGHHFGESLSAFPGLKALPGSPAKPGDYTIYSYPDGDKREAGWFGKNRGRLASTYYYFLDGKFVGFDAKAYGDNDKLLSQQVHYLLGPGQQRVGVESWLGEQVWAEYKTVYEGATAGQQLQMFTQAATAQQQRRQADELRAQN